MADDKFSIAESPERIWLAPQCEDERCWCPDKLDDCDECHSPAVEYVRADLFAAASSAGERMRERAIRAVRGAATVEAPTHAELSIINRVQDALRALPLDEEAGR